MFLHALRRDDTTTTTVMRIVSLILLLERARNFWLRGLLVFAVCSMLEYVWGTVFPRVLASLARLEPICFLLLL